MLKIAACFLAMATAQTLPFWKTKAKVYDRVQNREVIVSVDATDRAGEHPRYRLQADGGGQAAAPCEFVVKEAQNYEEIARLSGFVTAAKYNPASAVMDVTVEAFFHKADLQIAITGDSRRMKFQMVKGAMHGFTWGLAFQDVSATKCEIALTGEYAYDEFPIPRLFLEFGLEAVFKRMAEQLRDQVEKRWKSAQPKPSPSPNNH
jgi:hypothetical protein